MLTQREIDELKKTVPGFSNIFPPKLEAIYDDKFVKLLGESNRALGNLNNAKKIIPNPDLLISPVLFKEAFASSEIEGTQTTVRDVVQEEAEVDFDNKHEQLQAREVVNHIKATKTGLQLTEQYPLVSRIIKEMHLVLLHKVRGKHTTRGDFRVGPNAIERGKKIVYFPPPASEVPALMVDLENYLNDSSVKNDLDPLIRAAIVHYQFEAIHPFADGNGRLGRALISLQLINEGVLQYPVLYLSEFLLKNRDVYEDCLINITTKGEWKDWIIFFLEGIREQAARSEEIVQNIYDLVKTTKTTAKQHIKSPNTGDLVELVFSERAVTANDVSTSLKITHAASMRLLRKLEELKIVSVLNPKVKRNLLFVNEPLVRLLEAV